MDPTLRRQGEAARGFLLPSEGLALHGAGLIGGQVGPLLEVGSYCGKSAVYLGAAARECRTVLYTIDHHRGSEEQQPGQDYYEPGLVGPDGRIDSLPALRVTLAEAGLDEEVVIIVGRSGTVSTYWRTPLGLVFIDGSHTEESVRGDFQGWSPHLIAGGILAIHDVFPDPAEGGGAPFLVFTEALASGAFEPLVEEASLRVLRRIA
ncbi:MAG: class I SAM-dependent methyltransferase [Chloroflexi bacterium]|nr:MAG: class I SAM-dependent methyltransferase [Chloroflexota bacterium]